MYVTRRYIDKLLILPLRKALIIKTRVNHEDITNKFGRKGRQKLLRRCLATSFYSIVVNTHLSLFELEEKAHAESMCCCAWKA